MRAQFDVDEDCLQYPIPKLVIQPLVENALYHGIRPKGTKGTITISARSMKDEVRISISDDGVGMLEEEIMQILERKDQLKSFGLWGTMERLRIFYGNKNCIKIESELGKGMTITIIIPKG